MKFIGLNVHRMKYQSDETSPYPRRIELRMRREDFWFIIDRARRRIQRVECKFRGRSIRRESWDALSNVKHSDDRREAFVYLNMRLTRFNILTSQENLICHAAGISAYSKDYEFVSSIWHDVLKKGQEYFLSSVFSIQLRYTYKGMIP